MLRQWLLIIGSTAVFILCDSFAANWGKSNGKISLLLLFVLSPVGYILFGILNSTKSLSVSSGLVNMGLLVGTVLVGVFYFHDELTARQMAGLIFAVMAVIFMA